MRYEPEITTVKEDTADLFLSGFVRFRLSATVEKCLGQLETRAAIFVGRTIRKHANLVEDRQIADQRLKKRGEMAQPIRSKGGNICWRIGPKKPPQIWYSVSVSVLYVTCNDISVICDGTDVQAD